MTTHRDKDGQPLELLEWAALFEDPSYARVADTEIGDQRVWTQWEGMDDGVRVAPMYSTHTHAGGRCELQRLFWPCTLADAQAQHAAAVAKLKGGAQ